MEAETLTRKGVTYTRCTVADCRFVHLVIAGRAWAEWKHPGAAMGYYNTGDAANDAAHYAESQRVDRAMLDAIDPPEPKRCDTCGHYASTTRTEGGSLPVLTLCDACAAIFDRNTADESGGMDTFYAAERADRHAAYHAGDEPEYVARDGFRYPFIEPSATGCRDCRAGAHANCTDPSGDCGRCHPNPLAVFHGPDFGPDPERIAETLDDLPAGAVVDDDPEELAEELLAEYARVSWSVLLYQANAHRRALVRRLNDPLGTPRTLADMYGLVPYVDPAPGVELVAVWSGRVAGYRLASDAAWNANGKRAYPGEWQADIETSAERFELSPSGRWSSPSTFPPIYLAGWAPRFTRWHVATGANPDTTSAPD